ncbi:MAG TPA: DNA methyltransferase [Phycisphaerae bacterium]|nr:DNA methyltransferase [Phycisphaerae bacterium]
MAKNKSNPDTSTRRLIKDETALFDDSYQAELEEAKNKPVECLGMTFPNDAARREYFLDKLREKLQDPEFRKIEGFPIGDDEDILALSDPPYYTACPNPFIGTFVACHATPYDSSKPYLRPPMTRDVRQTRDTQVYSAHTYHTKVPPQAIVEYIQHYTDPGDIVVDAFAGSGMTGVACKLLARGAERHVILCDLAPAATFITATYLEPPDPALFDRASSKTLKAVCEGARALWTAKVDSVDAQVEFDVWSEVFLCPHCQGQIETSRVVSATEAIGSAKEFRCPHCDGLVSKAPTKASGATRLERHLQTRFDEALGRPTKMLSRAPLITQVTDARNGRRRIDTPPGHRRMLESLDYHSEYWFPTNPLIEGERYSWKDCLPSYGVTHIHHFYLPRQLRFFSHLWHLASSVTDPSLRRALQFFASSNALGCTILNRFGPTHYSQVNKYFSGTLYIPSVVAEASPRYVYSNKRKRLVKAFAELDKRNDVRHLITTQSSTDLRGIPDATVDYVFVDPPFGRNLQYSELNQIWEAWLRVHTNRQPEAVMDSTRGREVIDYSHVMRDVFAELCRILKPGRWMSVAFHNSSNAVWMGIQEGLMSAGFVVADVRTLDKERQSYKQIRQGTVKQDLVITAYRPNGGLEDRFRLEAGTEEGVWDFVRTHMKQLPVCVVNDGLLETITERQDFLLFDRMVAFHVQRGVTVPMSASEFYQGLVQRFAERDGMFFLPDQVTEYDRKRMSVKNVMQMEMFVKDEASAIQWLKHRLIEKPQTFQELHPQFMKEIGGWEKHEMPLELADMLAQNFLRYDGRDEVPSQIHAYLSSNWPDLRKKGKDDSSLKAKAKDRWYVPDPKKAGDLEKLRELALLREFAEYLPAGYKPAVVDDQQAQLPGMVTRDAKVPKGKRLKVIRLEAVRAGFKQCWQNRDYRTIIAVAQRIPENVLQEDPKLLMWYDQALTRLGEE